VTVKLVFSSLAIVLERYPVLACHSYGGMENKDVKEKLAVVRCKVSDLDEAPSARAAITKIWDENLAGLTKNSEEKMVAPRKRRSVARM
jgi:hypothetical protein